MPTRVLTPKARATRARLVTAATEVFAASGYAAASVRDIARRCGVSSGAIYGTFRGKAELLSEAVDASIANDLETLPEDVLRAPLPEIDAHQFATLDAPARVRLRALLLEAAVAARSDAEVRDRLRGTIDGRLRAWADAHHEWAAQRAIDDIDMDALVALLVAADLGLGVLEALGARIPSPDDWAALVRALIRGIDTADV